MSRGHQTLSRLGFKSSCLYTSDVSNIENQVVIVELTRCKVSGLSSKVIESRNALILSEIEKHAPNKEKYTLIAKVVNVGVALLVYGIDEGVGSKVVDVETQWTGCGPAYMGNKGAVGVRFRVPTDDGGVGETFTYVTFFLPTVVE